MLDPRIVDRKTIVIAGGSRGIGKAILVKFASAGFNAIVCSRNLDNLQALQTEFQQHYPDAHLSICAADLSQKSETQRLAQCIRNTGWQVDVLVNNVGVFVPGQICDEPDGNLEFMIQTNLYSAYYLTRELIGSFLERREGHIFNICSIASVVPYPKGSSYCISKFALLGMSKVLREELKPHNIKVTAILPSATLTDSWQGTDLPVDRFIQAQDVANLIYACYALSPQCVPEEIVLRPQAGDIL
jgi:short-subunit dehydrogenase